MPVLFFTQRSFQTLGGGEGWVDSVECPRHSDSIAIAIAKSGGTPPSLTKQAQGSFVDD